MTIRIKTSTLSTLEVKALKKFIPYIIVFMQKDFMNSTNPAKINSRKQDLIDADWMMWEQKPKDINTRKLINLIAECITYRFEKDYAVIYIDTTEKFPGAGATVNQVARFLDMGNENKVASNQITRIFYSYKSDLNQLWYYWWNTYVSDDVQPNDLIILR